LALGKGDLPLPELIRHLANDNYKGLVTLEVFPLTKSLFMPIANVEKILRQCLTFIKEHAAPLAPMPSDHV
jgi:sugar phosphate isomerase/epimerase